MSEIEKLWAAVQSKWGSPLLNWKDLSPTQHVMIVQAVNQMIAVCNSAKVNNANQTN